MKQSKTQRLRERIATVGYNHKRMRYFRRLEHYYLSQSGGAFGGLAFKLAKRFHRKAEWYRTREYL